MLRSEVSFEECGCVVQGNVMSRLSIDFRVRVDPGGGKEFHSVVTQVDEHRS